MFEHLGKLYHSALFEFPSRVCKPQTLRKHVSAPGFPSVDQSVLDPGLLKTVGLYRITEMNKPHRLWRLVWFVRRPQFEDQSVQDGGGIESTEDCEQTLS